MKKLFAFAAAASALVMAAPASAQSYDADREVEHFDDAAMITVMREAGATVTRETDSEGDPYLELMFANGYNGFATFNACDRPNQRSCRGLIIKSTWEYPDGMTQATVLERINEIGNALTTLAVYRYDEETIVMMRYMVIDGGRTMGNLKTEFELYSASLSDAADILYGTSRRK